MKKALCIGDNTIDAYLPPLNQKFIGGSAVNCAVNIKNTGADAAYLGAVGSDAEGRALLASLAERGIDVAACQRYEGRTANISIQLDAGGERHFIHSARVPGRPPVIDASVLRYIQRFNLVHTTWLSGVERCLSSFHNQTGNIVSMDFGDHCGQALLDAALPYVDMAFFSLPPDKRPAAETLAREIFTRGPKLVIVTLAETGSVGFDGELHFQEAIPTTVVDTLGAGDAYIGAFLAHWLEEQKLAECLRRAAIAAAHTCTHFGAWQGSALPPERDFPVR